MFDTANRAREIGFERSAAIGIDAIALSEELTSGCNPKACRKYASCWTCPPGAGSYEERRAHFEGKDAGVLVQTVRDDVDIYEDWEALEETRTLHHQRLDQLAAEMRSQFADVLEFSTGGCDLCAPCSYPDAPCLKPDEQRLSLSAHGVAVGETCKRAGLDYGFENGRLRYVGMIIYRK
ncbi:MAG TPA: hypothetical protein DCP91_05265 [Eggerthellaceae bacterium]|nr:hypothetical protein [Eggerthellaceae bacterium]